nr:hypothetical protein K-LCC10_0132 [Kaumoebavirus]
MSYPIYCTVSPVFMAFAEGAVEAFQKVLPDYQIDKKESDVEEDADTYYMAVFCSKILSSSKIIVAAYVSGGSIGLEIEKGDNRSSSPIILGYISLFQNLPAFAETVKSKIIETLSSEKYVAERSINKIAEAQSTIEETLKLFTLIVEKVKKLRDVAPVTGQSVSDFLDNLYNHYYWKPGGPGEKEAEDDFEKHCQN